MGPFRLLHFLCALLLYLGNQVRAQDVEWSSLEKFRNKTAYNRIIGSNESGFYVLRSRSYDINSKVIIERYRESMGLDFSKRLPDMRGMELIDAFVKGERVLVFKSRFNAQNERLELIVSQLDENANALGTPNTLLSIYPRSYTDEGDFEVFTNVSRSHFLVVYTEPAPQRKLNLNMVIFNHRFEKVSEKKVPIEFENDDYRVDQTLIDSSGNAYALVSGLNAQVRKGEPSRVSVYLYALGIQGDFQSHLLNSDNHYVHSPILSKDEVNNRLMVSGLFSYKSLGSSKGILSLTISDKNMTELSRSFIPFNQEFIRDIAGEKAAENFDELLDLDIRYMVSRTDGGFLLFAEEFSVVQQSYTYYVNGIAQVSNRSVYNYGKICVLSYGPDGKMEWSKIISKGQSSVNDFGYYSSFVICKKRDRIHVLFNDKLKGSGGARNYIIHHDDSIEESSLFGFQGGNISIVPSESMQIDGNTMLIPITKDRKFAFVKILF